MTRGYDQAVARASSGLRNMRDRVESVGGTLTVESSPGHGTHVRGVVPLAATASDDTTATGCRRGRQSSALSRGATSASVSAATAWSATRRPPARVRVSASPPGGAPARSRTSNASPGSRP